MPLYRDFISVLDAQSMVSSKQLKYLLTISRYVVSDNMHGLLELLSCFLVVNQDQLHKALEDTLVLLRQSFEVEFCQCS